MKIAKILLILLLFHVPNAWARIAITDRMQYPQPPAHNPNPPASVEDRRRVDFAVVQIQAKYGSNLEIRHPHVIPWSFEKFEKSRKTKIGNGRSPADASTGEKLPESPRVHSAKEKMKGPALKADEFMVHAYVRDLPGGNWRHLDVILNEDGSGQLSLRGFFDIAMPENQGALPPGVRC